MSLEEVGVLLYMEQSFYWGSWLSTPHFPPFSSTIMFFMKCSFQNYIRHTLFTSSIHSTHLLLTHSANYNCVFITVKCQVLNEELGMLLGKVSRACFLGEVRLQGSFFWE